MARPPALPRPSEARLNRRHRAADTASVDVLTVECLNCGQHHRLAREDDRHLRGGECPRCGYLGWAPPANVSERVRRALRDRRLEPPRLRPVA